MLKNNHRASEPPDKPERTVPVRTSRLGPALKFSGELTGSEDFTLEGAIEGRVLLENTDLTIAAGGRVKADLTARNVTIYGSVEGNIRASGLVLIEAQGRMSGDIEAARISIMEGAQFKGSVKITRP